MNETSFAHILFAPGVLEKLRRVCPVLTGCAGSFAPSAKSLKNQFMGDPFLPRQGGHLFIEFGSIPLEATL
jgi:hypothetical protein